MKRERGRNPLRCKGSQPRPSVAVLQPLQQLQQRAVVVVHQQGQEGRVAPLALHIAGSHVQHAGVSVGEAGLEVEGVHGGVPLYPYSMARHSAPVNK